jgi:hypothetical protein
MHEIMGVFGAKNATQCLAGIYGGETFLFGGNIRYMATPLW